MTTIIMLRIVKRFEINIQMLKEWGKEVRIDSIERCVSNTRSLVDVAQGINDIKNKLVIVLDQLRDAQIVTNNCRKRYVRLK